MNKTCASVSKTCQNSSPPAGQASFERCLSGPIFARPHVLTHQNILAKICSGPCFTKMAVSPLIMVRFEKFKNWLTQESKPVLQDGLGLRSARPGAVKPVSDRDGRTGSIFNTSALSTHIQM